MTRVALLANPSSGSGDAEGVVAMLRGGGAEVAAFGLDRIDEALAWGPERLVVAGGDGSLGATAAAAAASGVPLGIVPAGTANDFARSLGLPDDIAEAARLAAAGEATRHIDLAWMGERPFLNVASIGLPPAAARRASRLKRLLGPLAYAVGALRAGIAAQPVGCRIRCDGDELFAGQAWQATVACTGAFGAGAEIEADPSDGLLDVLVIEAGSRAGLAVRAYGLRRGSIASQRGVIQRRATVVDADVPDATPFNVDGEIVESGPARFTAQAHAVEVVVG